MIPVPLPFPDVSFDPAPSPIRGSGQPDVARRPEPPSTRSVPHHIEGQIELVSIAEMGASQVNDGRAAA